MEIKLDIFPNPTINELNINLTGLTDIQVTIYNVSGDNVFTKYMKGEASYNIPLSHLEPGSYYMLIENKEITKSFKFVKI